jgi:hypothetical protein
MIPWDGKDAGHHEREKRRANSGSNWMILLPIAEIVWLFSFLKSKI